MSTCLCSHSDRDHPGGECIHRACGCQEHRTAPAGATRSAASGQAGEGRAGICAGCGRSRYLHADGTVIAHHSEGSRSPAECGGSNRLPAGSGPGGTESAATGEAGAA